MDKFSTLLPALIETASLSKINQKLAAVIIKGGKMLNIPVCNIERATCHGFICGNMHAECNAIRKFYGSSLTYTPKLKWCLL
jgi:hypothetical protein